MREPKVGDKFWRYSNETEVDEEVTVDEVMEADNSRLWLVTAAEDPIYESSWHEIGWSEVDNAWTMNGDPL